MFDHKVTDKVVQGCKKFTTKTLHIYKTLFEDNQQELENNTERLSNLLDQPADQLAWNDELKKNIMGVTVLCDKRLQALFDVIQSDLMMEGTYLPKPKSVVSSGSHTVSSNFASLMQPVVKKPVTPIVVPDLQEYYDNKKKPKKRSKNKKKKQQTDDDDVIEVSDDDVDIQRAIQDSML